MATYRVIGTDGREYGPVAPEQLRDWIGAGRVTASTLVCVEGSLDWKPLGTLPEFRPFVTPVQPPVPATPAGPRRTNPWAVWGFVCGLLSLTLCSCCCLPLDLLGLVFSVIGLVQISNHPETENGTALAILGLVLSVVSLVLGLALSVLWFSSESASRCLRDLEREFGAGGGWAIRILTGIRLLN